MVTDDRSLWRRMLYSSPWDLLHGRVTGRHDVRYELMQAGLTPETAKYVYKMVDRLACFGQRKELIKRELTAHFLRGQEVGRSTEELLASFGSRRHVLRLIHWAIFRDQWPPVRWLFNLLVTVGYLNIAVVLAYFLTMLVAISHRPVMRVDYIAQLNAPATAAPVEDRAWPLYRDILLRPDWNADPDGLFQERIKAKGKYFSRTPLSGEAGWDQLVALLDEHQDMIRAIRVAADKPSLGFCVDYSWRIDETDRQAFGWKPEPAGEQDDPTDSLMMPHLGTLRSMAGWLGLDIQVAASRGDSDTVVADYAALMRIAGQAYEVPMQVPRAVACSLIAMANANLAMALVHDGEKLDDATLVSLIHSSMFGDEVITPTPTGNLLAVYAVVQRCYSDGGWGGGHVSIDWMRRICDDEHTPPWLNRFGAYMMLPAMYWLMPTRSQQIAKAERLFQLYEQYDHQPLWRRLHERSDFENELDAVWGSPLSILRYEPLIEYDPAPLFSRVARSSQMFSAITRLALALELHRRQLGQYPNTLEALAPRWVPRIPLDASTGRPLIYRVQDGQVVLYGRGLDGDDDGGELGVDNDGIPLRRDWPSNVPEDGDWLFWPPVIEPLLTEPPPEDESPQYFY